MRTYTEAVQWFAGAHLLGQGNRACWEEVSKQDVQKRVAWLLGRYSHVRQLEALGLTVTIAPAEAAA